MSGPLYAYGLSSTKAILSLSLEERAFFSSVLVQVLVGVEPACFGAWGED